MNTTTHPLAAVRRSLSIDAVTASIDAKVDTVARELRDYFGAVVAPCRPLRGMGYNHAAEVLSGDDCKRRCVIQYSEHHTKPCVTAEGTDTFDAPGLYEALCLRFAGDWYPSRLDPALDWHDPAAFDQLAAMLITFAEQRGIKIDQRGDWQRGKSRTLYLYSRESQCFVRLYEYRQYHGYGPDCRLEVEMKFKGQDKRARLARASPMEMLLMCPASHHVLHEVGIDLEPIAVSEGPRPPSTVERDLAFLSSTAYPALMRMISHHHGAIEDAVLNVIGYREETERVRKLLTQSGSTWNTSEEVIHLAAP